MRCAEKWQLCAALCCTTPCWAYFTTSKGLIHLTFFNYRNCCTVCVMACAQHFLGDRGIILGCVIFSYNIFLLLVIEGVVVVVGWVYIYIYMGVCVDMLHDCELQIPVIGSGLTVTPSVSQTGPLPEPYQTFPTVCCLSSLCGFRLYNQVLEGGYTHVFLLFSFFLSLFVCSSPLSNPQSFLGFSFPLFFFQPSVLMQK